MAKKESIWLKDEVAVAGAMGLELYDAKLRREQRRQQLQDVADLMECADFPKAQPVKGIGPNARDRAAVIAWLAGNVELHKNGRKFKLLDNRRAAKNATGAHAAQAHGDIPPADKPAGDDDLFGTLSAEELAEKKKRQLDYWQDIYLNPGAKLTQAGGIIRLTRAEADELRTNRPWLFQAGGAAGGQSVGEQNGLTSTVNVEGGFRGVANWIRNNYHGRLNRVPTHTDIQNWNKGEYLPAGCRENFPNSEAQNGRYKTAAVTAWVEKHLLKQASAQELPVTLDYRQAQEKLDYERATAEFTVWQQANSEAYVARDMALASVIRALKEHHAVVKRQFERGMGAAIVEQLRGQGFDHNQLALIAAAIGHCGRATIAAIETQLSEA